MATRPRSWREHFSACTNGHRRPREAGARLPAAHLADGLDRDPGALDHPVDLFTGDVERRHKAQGVRSRRVQQEARALPAGMLLEALPRISHDAAAALGAQVERPQEPPAALVRKPELANEVAQPLAQVVARVGNGW